MFDLRYCISSFLIGSLNLHYKLIISRIPYDLKSKLIVLRGVALSHRKTMVANEAFSKRTLQKGSMGGSMKELFQWKSVNTSIRRRMRN